jgi:hypothetical protein
MGFDADEGRAVPPFVHLHAGGVENSGKFPIKGNSGF